MAEPGPGLQAEVGKVDEEKETAAPAPKKRRLAAGERYVPPPRKLRSGVSFSAAHFAETSYYFEGGLRKVRPYYYDFRTYCKGRWVGRSLLPPVAGCAAVEASPPPYYSHHWPDHPSTPLTLTLTLNVTVTLTLSLS